MMVRFLLVKSHKIYEISENLLKSVKSFEISEIKVNSTDFEIRTPFWRAGDPLEQLVHDVDKFTINDLQCFYSS